MISQFPYPDTPWGIQVQARILDPNGRSVVAYSPWAGPTEKVLKQHALRSIFQLDPDTLPDMTCSLPVQLWDKPLSLGPIAVARLLPNGPGLAGTRGHNQRLSTIKGSHFSMGCQTVRRSRFGALTDGKAV